MAFDSWGRAEEKRSPAERLLESVLRRVKEDLGVVGGGAPPEGVVATGEAELEDTQNGGVCVEWAA